MATYNGTSGADTYTGGNDPDAINGLGGNDSLSGWNGADTIHGGSGNDVISGTDVVNYSTNDDGAADKLYGEDGNDLISFSTGDLADGGAGNDTLLAGGSATITGGAGTDTLRVPNNYDISDSIITGMERLEAYSYNYGVHLTANEFNSFATVAGIGSNTGVMFTLTGAGAGTVNLDPTVTAVTIYGSAATEGLTFATTTAAITYVGGSGNGTIVASGGNDSLSGWNGADTIHGGSGNDVISGTDVVNYSTNDDGAADKLYGEDGNDLIGLSTGDTADGGAGNDTLTTGGAATLLGGDGNDLLIGSLVNDSLNGAAGNDTASYERSSQPVTVNLSLTGGQATGGGGTDTLVGIENLIGGSGNDKLTGSGGDNVIEGAGGNDSLVGGSGSDTASYVHATVALAVDLRITSGQNTLGAGTDTLSGFENLTGGSGDDTLTGTTGANVIEGGAGNDSLIGLGGSDTASYAGAGTGITVSLAATSQQTTGGAGSDWLIGFENLRGSAFGDRLTGDTGANRLDGLAGNDTLVGGGGVDTLVGGTGNDVYKADADDVITEATDASGGVDQVQSTTAWTLATGLENLTLTGSASVAGTGNAAANTLIGNGAANLLSGLDGADGLNGGAGADTLVGGAGADRLTGSTGADVFDFNLASESTPTARDVILDFAAPGAAAGDRIDLSGIDADTTVSGNQTFTFGSSAIHGLVLSTEGTDTLVQGNTDSDAAFEFSLLIRDGATQASAYTAADFIL